MGSLVILLAGVLSFMILVNDSQLRDLGNFLVQFEDCGKK